MLTLNRTIVVLLAAGLASNVFAQKITCSGAELYSKSTVKYGRWEIRMQVAATPGSVSSFFTYYDNSWEGMPEPWREIDIEVLGNKPNSFQSNLITGSYNTEMDTGKITSELLHDVSNASKEFKTYTLDWTPDSVVWRVNGQTLRKTTTTSPQVLELREKDQSWRMNLWASTSPTWVGTLDLSKLPVYQVVNWMRYSSYTPGAGPNGSNFTESWIDDFNSFSNARWAKGDWTFGGNQAQLTASNIVVKNGYLVLALTKPDAEGVTGTVPTDPDGSTYKPTGILGKGVSSSTWKANATGRGIQIEGWEGSNGLLEVRDLNGVQVASAHSSNRSFEVPVAHAGVFVVRAGDRTLTVVR